MLSVLSSVVFAILASRRGCSPADVPDFAAHFGSKTRYEDSSAYRRLLAEPAAVDRSLPSGERCSPVHLTAVVRHGSRYPTVKNIRAMRQLSDLLRTASRDEGEEGERSAAWRRDVLRRWDMWYTEDMDGQLVPKGREDLRQLATRLAVSFPSLLGEESLRAGRVRVLTSSKHRCVSSAEAFQEGLHLSANVTPVHYRHQVDDGLLRSFDTCRGYVEGVEKNRTALAEVYKFKRGTEMEALRKKVADKLGLPHRSLTPDLLEAAFFLCSYELAIKSLHSPWCFLFDREDAKVLEYKCDLKLFWKRAHGHAITLAASCPLFHHVFRSLDKAGRPRRSSDTPPEPASILIGHAETLLPFLGLLDLYKDETPPTADNYQSQHACWSRTQPTWSWFCWTAREAPTCRCWSTRRRFDSRACRRRTRRCIATCGRRTATCWTDATFTKNARARPAAADPTPNSEWPAAANRRSSLRTPTAGADKITDTFLLRYELNFPGA
ncbi:multiple inositol polyphosphate phosphatase 1b isoform X2 [Phycodurus eques]|uniref:multiple inositol polyphosphate phosphatase 1b isoform X2 n=1 Tax=Phycodurus eques TaxID=693459 RepID=UPI002ACDD5C7|nr:multiple inositol polyphosphate phosphatase 1b isoform X2 [Phycodurus eques]